MPKTSSGDACATRRATWVIGSEFDFVVVNDDFDRALGDLQAIVRGEGQRSRGDRPGLATLAAGLTATEAGGE